MLASQPDIVSGFHAKGEHATSCFIAAGLYGIFAAVSFASLHIHYKRASLRANPRAAFEMNDLQRPLVEAQSM